MASNREYLEFVLEQLSEIEDISSRPMMGEYLLYYKGKYFGGVFDDQFLVKITPSALKLMPDAEKIPPYEGAKGMLVVTAVYDRTFLAKLLAVLYEELPVPKKKIPGKVKTK